MTRRSPGPSFFLPGLAACALLLSPHADAAGLEPPAPTEPPPAVPTPPQPAPPQPTEVVVQAPEPRYVAPTLRDRIGRIWAPVRINGKGPFRLVLDTGASDCAITAQVAQALGLVPEPSHVVLVQGVAGNAIVPTVPVRLLSVGDLDIGSVTLPVIPDALGGAEGVLGTAGLTDKRIDIDFLHDRISITHSRGQHAPLNFVTLHLERSDPGLLMVAASVARVRVHAVIDTGAERSIGNEALRRALVSRHARGTPDQIYDVTTHVQGGEMFDSPTIEIGGIKIEGARITYGEVHIFEHWQLTQQPALLIGMDALGLLDELVIDYHLRELQLRTR